MKSAFDHVAEFSINEKTFILDGEFITSDTAAYINKKHEMVMVPLRLAVNYLYSGSNDQNNGLQWEDDGKTITFSYKTFDRTATVSFTDKSDTFYVDGIKKTMEDDCYAEIKDGVMYVPFRELGKAIDVTADWDAETKTVTFNRR